MTRAKRQVSPERLTLKRLDIKFKSLSRRVEDLEDLRDLNDAIKRNAGKQGTPWSEVKTELGL